MGALDRIACVLERPHNFERVRALAQGRFPVTDRIEALLDAKPETVVECAGHAAVRSHGAAVLRHGVDLIIAATGCLADQALAGELVAAAKQGGRLLIPSGAVAGLDG